MEFQWCSLDVIDKSAYRCRCSMRADCNNKRPVDDSLRHPTSIHIFAFLLSSSWYCRKLFIFWQTQCAILVESVFITKTSKKTSILQFFNIHEHIRFASPSLQHLKPNSPSAFPMMLHSLEIIRECASTIFHQSHVFTLLIRKSHFIINNALIIIQNRITQMFFIFSVEWKRHKENASAFCFV